MLDVYIWNSKVLIWGNDFSNEFHFHYPIQIIISTENMNASLKNGKEINSKIIIIGSNVVHKCVTQDSSISLFIDPETMSGKKISNYINDNKLESLTEPAFYNLSPTIFDKLKDNKGNFPVIKEIFNDILNSYIKNDDKYQELDFRIKNILDRIQVIPFKKISVSELASYAHISESRLMHLFKNNIGIPIRRYLLWKRLIDGILLIQKGESFSYAAYESGFSDYAHFSRTFKSNFGVTLKKIFKNDRFIHVYVSNTV